MSVITDRSGWTSDQLNQLADTVSGGVPSLEDAQMLGFGLKTQAFDTRVTGPTNTALVSQTIYAISVPVRAGMTVSNASFFVGQIGTGTVPTSIAVGICSPTASLIVSPELKSDAAWGTANFRSVSLGANYTFTYDGIAYVMILENGAFGTQVLQLSRCSSFNVGTGLGSLFYATAGTGQTALPAAGSAVTLVSTGTPLAFWAALS